jgi:multidrug resistance efflux pump
MGTADEVETLHRQLAEARAALSLTRGSLERTRLRLELSQSYLQIVIAMAHAGAPAMEIENAARRGLFKKKPTKGGDI